MIVGGMRLMTYDNRVTFTSGASAQGASVVAAPPVLERRSSTTVRAPLRARYADATRPLWPPPTTMASKSELMRIQLLVSTGLRASGLRCASGGTADPR